MKRNTYSYMVGLTLVLGSCFARDMPWVTEDYENALRHGAKAKLTIHVLDDKGLSISNATCHVGFADIATTIEKDIGFSDANGLFVAEGTAKHEVGGWVEKDGFYMSHFKFEKGDPPGLIDNGGESSMPYYASKVKDGRWLPWNPTIPVVLKRIRNPVDMILKFAHMRIPQFNEPLGFDLEKHDWVTPDGKGEVPDMLVRFETIDETSPFRKLVVEFPGEMNGAYVCRKDDYSILKSDYHAMTNGVYETRIENNEGKRGPAHVLLGGDDYIVFRVRCKVDENGKLISAHYGKIYGPFDYFVQSRNTMRLSTMFNPIENDTNLEFNGKGWDDVLFGR